MDESIEMVDGIIPSVEYPFILVEPGEETLYFPSSLIPSEFSSILSLWLYPIALMWGNQFNSHCCESFIERIRVIGTIPDKSSRSSQGEGRIEGSFDKGDFMR